MKPISVIQFALALSAAVLAGGCSTYEVKVDAVSRRNLPTGSHTSYTIQNRNPAIATDSLRYKEAAQRIKTALSGHGLWEAPDPSTADMIVDLDYDIEPAKVVYREVDVEVFVPKVPVLGQLGGRELVGVEKGTVRTVVREKHLSVSCRENEPATERRPTLELWRISVGIEDERNDLRECLPVLASEVMEQIGKTTDGVIIKRVDPNIARSSLSRRAFDQASCGSPPGCRVFRPAAARENSFGGHANTANTANTTETAWPLADRQNNRRWGDEPRFRFPRDSRTIGR
jgi:hypothetical protein